MGVEQVLTGNRGSALSGWMGLDIKNKMVKANLRLGQGSQVRSIQEEYWTSNSWRVDEFDVGLNNSQSTSRQSIYFGIGGSLARRLPVGLGECAIQYRIWDCFVGTD